MAVPDHALEQAKQRLGEAVDQRADLLVDVSHQIHARPELCFEERFAHDLLTKVLEGEGLSVTRSAYGLETAFEASAGRGGPTVAVLCEYDALPEIGHGCGHNIIAAAGLGAGLAAASLAEELGGQVVVLGTPAEEGGGGKVFMIEGGAFEGVEAALMVHPADADLVAMDVVALEQVIASYHGQAAHAAAFPQMGRNALDACVLGYVNVAALRQHIASGERIHGVVTHGGDKPNIVPAFAQSEWNLRTPKAKALEQLKERFVACLEAGAQAAGCTVELEWRRPTYADMVHNRAIGESYRANALDLGRKAADPSSRGRVVASTDMGNVSYAVPSIHPVIQVAPPGTAIHTPAFADLARGPDGDRAVLDGAKLLARTVADLWLDQDLRARMREEFTAVTLR